MNRDELTAVIGIIGAIIAVVSSVAMLALSLVQKDREITLLQRQIATLRCELKAARAPAGEYRWEGRAWIGPDGTIVKPAP